MQSFLFAARVLIKMAIAQEIKDRKERSVDIEKN